MVLPTWGTIFETPMFELIASIVALCSLGVSAMLAFRVRSLSERLEAAERQLAIPAIRPELAQAVSPLTGLRVALQLDQDHTHPVFANLLKELLVREDISIESHAPDLLISGRIVCNGYADVYYTAEITCRLGSEPICVLIEKPPHGDRQENLARELVAKLRKELLKTTERSERSTALRELE
jgi:hypothetical protein